MMHGREVVYFTGNSLGLQPKATQDYVLNEYGKSSELIAYGGDHVTKEAITPETLSK